MIYYFRYQFWYHFPYQKFWRLMENDLLYSIIWYFNDVKSDVIFNIKNDITLTTWECILPKYLFCILMTLFIIVYRLEDHMAVYTLHGHCGPITSVFIDHLAPICAGSGSQDGMLCLWDLLTGACVYSIQAHDGSVLSLSHSPSYVISMGADLKLCIWERFQGHLINNINLVSIILEWFPGFMN